MVYHYSYKPADETKTALALGIGVDASSRHGREVANFIRGKNVEAAVILLEEVIEKKTAVPYRFFKRDLGHKTGIGPGRYPVKTSKAILAVVKNAIANAQHKGLTSAELALSHISIQKASAPWHGGRKGRRKMKRCNIEIALEPMPPKSDEKKKKNHFDNKPFKKHKNGGNR
jgi:large subunit ribosomal protein L22